MLNSNFKFKLLYLDLIVFKYTMHPHTYTTVYIEKVLGKKLEITRGQRHSIANIKKKESNDFLFSEM